MGYKGPRLIIKADWEDSTGKARRGCILTEGNTRPEVWAIVQSALRTAPHAMDAVTVSEGWRKIRETLDRHELHDAFDFSLREVSDVEAERRTIGDAWAARMRVDLIARQGVNYYVTCHGANWNVHIHGSLSP
jgi:hypothetical protein